MKAVKDVTVNCIAQTRLNKAEIQQWMEHHGLQEWDEDGTDAEVLIGLAGKNCYRSFDTSLNTNLTRVRKGWYDYIGHLLKTKHGSVLEHATWTFAIEDCTRVFTAEWNRHRVGHAISEVSLRFVRPDEWKYLIPPSVQDDSTESQHIRAILDRSFKRQEEDYNEIMRIKLGENANFAEKKHASSLARRVFGMGICTGIVTTMNLRTLRHVFSLRVQPEAEEEIIYIGHLLALHMVGTEPTLFQDIELSPYYTILRPEGSV